MFEREPRRAEATLETAPHRVEFLRRGALEGEDRLLFVADREEAARARRLREFIGDDLQNLPLRRARVLRLVEQNVIDLLIELV